MSVVTTTDSIDYAFDKLEAFAAVQRGNGASGVGEAFSLFLASMGMEGEYAARLWRRMTDYVPGAGSVAMGWMVLGIAVGLAMSEYEQEHAQPS